MTEKPRQRRTRKPVETRREEVLDAALDLVAEGGFSSLTMEGIAREAGVSKPVVYAAYPDLDRLVIALVDREHAQLIEAMAAVSETAKTLTGTKARLGAWLAGMADLVVRAPRPWIVMLVRPEDSPAYLRETIRSGWEALRQQLGDTIGVTDDPERVFGTPDAELVTHLLTAMAEHFAALMLRDPDQFRADRLLSFAAALAERLVED